MRVRLMGCMVAVLAVAMMSQTALACHKCRQNPCVLVVAAGLPVRDRDGPLHGDEEPLADRV